MLLDAAWEALENVMDPEVPVLSVVDLGIIRDLALAASSDEVVVTLTPTYSGCPAIVAIEQAVADALREQFSQVEVRTALSPAWTTDWMTDRGRQRLREYGIAPPGPARVAPRGSHASGMRTFATIGSDLQPFPDCPRCGSQDVERISQFGSTACKSLWRCCACREPFDHFKAI